ncbi:MAG: hypothetical protein HY608_06765 [Planctomycetes bacterium]|nr:hypothetical protein [Planctomycetota bacterium]
MRPLATALLGAACGLAVAWWAGLGNPRPEMQATHRNPDIARVRAETARVLRERDRLRGEIRQTLSASHPEAGTEEPTAPETLPAPDDLPGAVAAFDEAASRADIRGMLDALSCMAALGEDAYGARVDSLRKVAEDPALDRLLGTLISRQDTEFLLWLALDFDGDLGPLLWNVLPELTSVRPAECAERCADAAMRLPAEGSGDTASVMRMSMLPVGVAGAEPASEARRLLVGLLDAPSSIVRQKAAFFLAKHDTAEVRAALERAGAVDPDPDVRTAARNSLLVLSPPAEGLLLSTLTGNLLQQTGLAPNDLILDYDGIPVRSGNELLSSLRSGGRLRFIRDGAVLYLDVEKVDTSGAGYSAIWITPNRDNR